MVALDNIIIKSDYVLDGLISGKYPEVLREMAFATIKAIRDCGVTPTMTSSWRKEDKGVHGFFRGLDFRSWELTKQQIAQILTVINGLYEYDHERPEKLVLKFHDTGRGPHLHLQSHPNTKKRGSTDERMSGRGM